MISLSFLSSAVKLTEARKIKPPVNSFVVVFRIECASCGFHEIVFSSFPPPGIKPVVQVKVSITKPIGCTISSFASVCFWVPVTAPSLKTVTVTSTRSFWSKYS